MVLGPDAPDANPPSYTLRLSFKTGNKSPDGRYANALALAPGPLLRSLGRLVHHHTGVRCGAGSTPSKLKVYLSPLSARLYPPGSS